jgi:hypothetical protein
MGGKISSSLFGICIVLLLAYLVWEIAKTAIDAASRRGQAGADVPASRLQTLLPLLRGLIFVTIVVMATMSFLAALGVDILPLLAGASVVGVAIGFGSQTLVRDIVSGRVLPDGRRVPARRVHRSRQPTRASSRRSTCARCSCAITAARSTSCPTARSSAAQTRAATGSST